MTTDTIGTEASPVAELRPAIAEERELPPTQHWCIITPQYPPLPGNIGDHTFLLTRALTEAGDTVEVWVPPGPPAPSLPGVRVHVLPSEYGLDSLRILRRVLREDRPNRRVLVQYSPTAFGMRRLNLPFALLLFMRRRRGIDLYFHGAGYPIRWRAAPRRALSGVLHRAMTWLVVRGAPRVFVAIPEWQRHLRRLGVRESDRDRVVTWVPVPSSFPDRADEDRVRGIRATLAPAPATRVIGHFGRYGAYHQRLLPRAIERVLDAGRSRTMLLVGLGSVAVRDAVALARPDLVSRIVATGPLDAPEVSAHLAACDILLQPYEEGASANRASLIAALALGCAVVTNSGPETGPLWTTRRSVSFATSDDPAALASAVTRLLDDAALRAALGADARVLHEELFAMSRGITRLRSSAIATADANTDPPTSEIAEGSDAIIHEAPSPVGTTTDGSPRVLVVHAGTLDDAAVARRLGATVHQLANALADTGVAVTVASRGTAPSSARYAHRSLATSPFAPPSVAEFDVVHYFGGDRFALRRTRPSVRTVHDQSASHRTLASRLARPLDRLAISRATIAVAAGGGIAARASIGEVISGGINIDRFPVRRRPAARRILFVGTLDGAGRGRWLTDIFLEHVLPRHTDAELHLVADVAPPSHAGMRFDPLDEDADLSAAYAGARILVAPSTTDDPHRSVLEALASGVPVLASPTPGAIELLGNGRFGVLADDVVFADALLRLLDDDATQERLALAGRGRAESLSWHHVAESYRAVYERAMAYWVGVPSHAPLPLAPVQLGPLRGLLSATPPGRVDDAVWDAFAELMEGALALVDVGAGDGDATLFALERASVGRVVAAEPDGARRKTMRRVLTANGRALDPRFDVDPRPAGAFTDDDSVALDDLAASLESPIVVRVDGSQSLEQVLAGASQTLARRSTRWLVEVPAADRERYELAFYVKGYIVRHVATRRTDSPTGWLIARR